MAYLLQVNLWTILSWILTIALFLVFYGIGTRIYYCLRLKYEFRGEWEVQVYRYANGNRTSIFKNVYRRYTEARVVGQALSGYMCDTDWKQHGYTYELERVKKKN